MVGSLVTVGVSEFREFRELVGWLVGWLVAGCSDE